MRLVIHDYSGHLCALSLARSLAGRGHEVLHLYSASFLTPHGDLQRKEGDPATFSIEPVSIGRDVDKSNLLRRRQADTEHGRLAARTIAEFQPHVVVTANTPLEAVDQIQGRCHELGARHVFWVQDLIGIAADRILREKFPLIGAVVGSWYKGYEQRLLRRADQAVVISDDFRPFVPVEPARVHTIENWSPIGEVPLRPKSNAWSAENGFSETTNVVYTGTLGMKHNPNLLVAIAERYRDRGEVRVVVVSEGASAAWLREQATARNLKNLVVLPFQPASVLPEVLGSADLLVGILEPAAGVFSVPSKVLSYLCSGRAILLAVPPENLIARIVGGHGAGLVVPPGDEAGFVAAAERILGDSAERQTMGAKAREYAEATFDVERITDRFEAILEAARA